MCEEPVLSQHCSANSPCQSLLSPWDVLSLFKHLWLCFKTVVGVTSRADQRQDCAHLGSQQCSCPWFLCVCRDVLLGWLPEACWVRVCPRQVTPGAVAPSVHAISLSLSVWDCLFHTFANTASPQTFYFLSVLCTGKKKNSLLSF